MRARVLLSIAMAGALIAVPQQVTHAQHEKQPFCLQSPTGSMNCTSDSLEQCQQILGGRSVSGTCVANPAWSETTGTGGASSPDRPPDSRDHPPSPAR
jgi:Protein of unknown function (DUF3551)